MDITARISSTFAGSINDSNMEKEERKSVLDIAVSESSPLPQRAVIFNGYVYPFQHEWLSRECNSPRKLDRHLRTLGPNIHTLRVAPKVDGKYWFGNIEIPLVGGRYYVFYYEVDAEPERSIEKLLVGAEYFFDTPEENRRHTEEYLVAKIARSAAQIKRLEVQLEAERLVHEKTQQQLAAFRRGEEVTV